jgi:protein-tyrosine-phosphatase
VTEEKGVDISHSVPKMLTAQTIEQADLVLTMGCSVEEVCPRPTFAKMQKRLVDWDLEDPKRKTVEEVRRISGEIEANVRKLSDSHSSFEGIQMSCLCVR